MNKLRTSDLLSILDCAAALYAHDDLGTFPQRLVEVLPGVLNADYTSYSEVDPTGHTIPRAYINPPEINTPELGRAMAPYVHEHPVVMYYQNTGDGTAYQISDFLSRDEFQRLGLYQNFYRTIGVEDQLSMALPASAPAFDRPEGAPAPVIGVSFSRSTWRFPERERQILNALRPHVLQAHRNAAVRTHLAAALGASRDALDSMPHGVITIDATRRHLTLLSKPAERFLATYFDAPAPGEPLPDPLLSYVRAPAPSVAPPAPLSVRRDGYQLFVEPLAPGADGSLMLLLAEHRVVIGGAPSKPATARAHQYGLTPREAEVLDWLAEGKTNPEIATILNISPRTVQKHLEHAFQKLSVENRSAAILRLLEHPHV